jgi:protein-S-isoprenylcysteine O-methyltransferase Ste14
MKAFFEFRLRFWIVLAIYTLGFTAPWDYVLHLDGAGPNSHVWGQLAVLLSKGGTLSIASAFNLVLVVGIVCAFLGAGLRTWGAAYLGIDGMRDKSMRADEVVANGPYRYVRNPLYLGMVFNTLALALLMPMSGAIFTLALVAATTVHTILREETFLRGKLGESYTAYCAEVPRLLPALRRPTSQKRDVGHPILSPGARPQWGQAFAAEMFMWGVAISFAVLGWKYNAHLLIQCVLVSLGVALIVQGIVKGPEAAKTPDA